MAYTKRKKPFKSEARVKAEVRRALGMVATLFDNVRGKFWGGKLVKTEGDRVTLEHVSRPECGLKSGASDLIGWRSVIITPEMVGSRVAIFVAIETKPEKGNSLSEAQANFIEQVRKAGGLAGMARSANDAHLIIAGPWAISEETKQHAKEILGKE